jgi:hypothetical protein
MVDTAKSHRIFTSAVDLILAPDGTQFQKGKARVHRQHHDGSEQYEEGVVAYF